MAVSGFSKPGEVDWSGQGIDIVLECSGKFRAPEALAPYFERGVKKVMVAAPVKKAGTPFFPWKLAGTPGRDPRPKSVASRCAWSGGDRLQERSEGAEGGLGGFLIPRAFRKFLGDDLGARGEIFFQAFGQLGGGVGMAGEGA